MLMLISPSMLMLISSLMLNADADVFSHADADAECLCLGISESVPNAERASSRGELYEGQGSAEQCQEYLSVNSGRQTMQCVSGIERCWSWDQTRVA